MTTGLGPIQSIDENGGKLDFEQPEETEREDDEQDRDGNIHPRVSREKSGPRGPQGGGQNDAEGSECQDDAEAVEDRPTDWAGCFLASALALLRKERNGDRDHRKHARRQKGEEPHGD